MAVIEERSKWVQNIREVEFLGLVTDYLSLQLRGSMLVRLTLTFVCLAFYMQSLLAVRRCVIPGGLCLPLLPTPTPCKGLLFLAHPTLIISLIHV